MSETSDLWLDGLRVLDVTTMLPGPFTTMLLGDMGAEVIKVESRWAADATRVVPPKVEGTSTYFAALNRNKRSIVLDLKSDEGRTIGRELVETADILVESFRPGVMERLGLDYETVSELRPDIVYCSISGYGQDGPDAERAGHDINYMARAGLLHQNGAFEGPPVVPGFQVADLAGGLYAATKILGALLHRARQPDDETSGGHLDISLTESALSLYLPMLAGVDAGASAERGAGQLSGGLPTYDVYRTSDDRYLAIGALEVGFALKLLQYLDEELDVFEGTKPDFDLFGATPSEMTPGEGREALAEVFARRQRDEWLDLLGDKDFCCEPVQSPEEVLEDQLFEARDVFFELAGVQHGRTPLTPSDRDHAPPPELNEHADEILDELGYSEDEVESLREGDVL